MRYALVSGGVVVNVAEWDGVSAWAPPSGQTAVLAPAGVGIGWSYDGTNFTAPPPVALTPAQQVERDAIAVQQADIAALLTDVDFRDLLTRINGASLSQLKTFLTNNIVDFASAKAILIKVCLVAAYVLKNNRIK